MVCALCAMRRDLIADEVSHWAGCAKRIHGGASNAGKEFRRRLPIAAVIGEVVTMDFSGPPRRHLRRNPLACAEALAPLPQTEACLRAGFRRDHCFQDRPREW